MAVRKINESTLTAIGNAIRAKTGGSALINPEDMATEIESIKTGGAVLLADETLTEDTFTFEIPFTEAMRGYDLYKVVATGLIVGGNFLYFSVNTAQRTRYWNISSMGYVAFVESSLLFGAAYSIPFTPPIQKIIAEPYSNTGTLKSGFNIKIWGYKN